MNCVTGILFDLDSPNKPAAGKNPVATAPGSDLGRAADYADLSGECYPVTVLEESGTQVRLRFAAGVPRPPGWAKEGWFPRAFLC